LQAYCNHTHDGHAPFAPAAAFAMHQQFMDTGDMHGVDWSRHFARRP